jgi:hypothetical protein
MPCLRQRQRAIFTDMRQPNVWRGSIEADMLISIDPGIHPGICTATSSVRWPSTMDGQTACSLDGMRSGILCEVRNEI